MNARNDSLSEIDEVAIYVLGRVEQFIEDFAKSSGTSAYELTERVAALLHSQTVREGLGADDSLPPLRDSAASYREQLEPLEVDDHPHSDRAPVGRGRKKSQHWDNFERGKDRFAVAQNLWAQGLTLKQIAKKMRILPHTAGSYINRGKRRGTGARVKPSHEDRQRWREYKRKARASGAVITGATKKGGTYHGKHWMQNPANRDKMMAQMKHMHEIKNEMIRQRVQ